MKLWWPNTLAVVITHAAFDAQRRAAVSRLVEELQQNDIVAHLADDHDRLGSLWCWKRAMQIGFNTEASHIVWLPDDATLCPRFGELLHRAVAAQPEAVFDCYANHDRAPIIESPWYTTPDGYTGVGGCMPRALLTEHLRWRDAHLDDRAANDEGVNLWAMATGRLIWKTTRSLAGHRIDIRSLDGNAHHSWREPATMSDGRDEDWSSAPVHVGRTYTRNHWGLMTKVKPPMTRRAYEVERDTL